MGIPKAWRHGPSAATHTTPNHGWTHIAERGNPALANTAHDRLDRALANDLVSTPDHVNPAPATPTPSQ